MRCAQGEQARDRIGSACDFGPAHRSSAAPALVEVYGENVLEHPGRSARPFRRDAERWEHALPEAVARVLAALHAGIQHREACPAVERAGSRAAERAQRRKGRDRRVLTSICTRTK
jgi:Mn-dependent DtxR family transcriptional regulator